MRLNYAALSAAFLVLGACSKKESAVIFITSRLEGRIAAAPDPDRKGARTGGLAVFRNLYQQEQKPKLALDCGNWRPETPKGQMLDPKAIIECLNAVPYSAAALGQRDLGASQGELENLAKTASFPLLASNLYLKNNKKPDFLRSSAVLVAGGLKIGIFSINVSDPQKPNQPRYLANYRLEKESYEIERALKTLKAAGAKLTVMLLNINPDSSAKPAFYRKFLEGLPKTDLVVTDEPSLKKPFRVGRTWVVPAGRRASAARVRLFVDPATGILTGVKWKMISLDAAAYGEHPETLKVINGHLRAVHSRLNRRVGFLAKELKLKEGDISPIGNFTAGCIQRWARTNAALLLNSDLATGLSSGPVTVGDLYTAIPYDSSVVFVKILGADLMSALEDKTLSDISAAGLKIVTAEDGQKSIEGEFGPLAQGRLYHLAVPDSIVNSRDYPILPNAMEFVNSRRYLREIVGWCFTRPKTAPVAEPAQEGAE